MRDPAYRVAREVACSLAEEFDLSPPFDIERLARRFAQVEEDQLPASADVITLHASTAGDPPLIVLDAGLQQAPERRRFALAHGLAHVLLGWHPLGMPCDVSSRPWELPSTVHALVEGEANAFSRELLMPGSWVAGFDALDRPALLAKHVAERAGQAPMPAARAVAAHLPPGYVWCVTDQWNRVVDGGRSPDTHARAPRAGEEFDAAEFARHAVERHRDQLDGMQISYWRFDATAVPLIPHDRTARMVLDDIARDIGLDDVQTGALAARVEGVAGWANSRHGTASIAGMRRALDERAHAIDELSSLVAHPEFDELVDAKATELVARRLAR